MSNNKMVHNLVMYSKLPSEISFSLVIVPHWYSNTHRKKKKRFPMGSWNLIVIESIMVSSHAYRQNFVRINMIQSYLLNKHFFFPLNLFVPHERKLIGFSRICSYQSIMIKQAEWSSALKRWHRLLISIGCLV